MTTGISINDLQEALKRSLAGLIITYWNKYDFSGQYGEHHTEFLVTYESDEDIQLGSREFSHELVDALSQIVGYKPAFRYERRGRIEVVWVKDNPGAFFKKLMQDRVNVNFVWL